MGSPLSLFEAEIFMGHLEQKCLMLIRFCKKQFVAVVAWLTFFQIFITLSLLREIMVKNFSRPRLWNGFALDWKEVVVS